MTHRFVLLREVVTRVLLKAVTVPNRPYYVNYDVREVWFKSSKGPSIYEYKYHIGPYPKLIAQFLLEHWVSTQLHRGECEKEYVANKALCLKPRKDSEVGPTPTKADMEHLLMGILVEPLEVYRELLALPEVIDDEVR